MTSGKRSGPALFSTSGRSCSTRSTCASRASSRRRYSTVLSLWGGLFTWVAVRNSRPLARRPRGGATANAPSRPLAETLPRLRSRQDRRLVARILERAGVDRRRVGAVSSAGGLLTRAASSRTRSPIWIRCETPMRPCPARPERALAELRREEVMRMVLRADFCGSRAGSTILPDSRACQRRRVGGRHGTARARDSGARAGCRIRARAGGLARGQA